MHVLFITTTYPPDNGWGGIGTYVHHMAKAMAAAGHQATVLCGVGDREYETTDGNLTVVRRIRMQGVSLDGVREQIGDLLYEITRSRGVDVVEFGEHGAEGLVFQRRCPSFPVVVRLHCSSTLCVRGNDPLWKHWARQVLPSKALKYSDACERECVSRAHVVTSCCRWLLDTYDRLGWRFPSERRSILNPMTNGTPIGQSAEKDYGSPRILFLGRLSRQKGADVIPGVANRVWREVPEAQFDVIGQDVHLPGRMPWKDWILAKTPARYHANLNLRGGVPHEEVGRIVATHSLAFFASPIEAMPYSHLECMQAGVACVVASGGGAVELGEHEVSLIRTRRRSAQIADWLVRLLRAPELRRRIGTEARRRVDQAFSPQPIVREMVGAYSKAIELAQVNKS